MKERKKLREGIIRINVNDLVEKTDLSLSRQDDLCRKVYVKSVDLEMIDDFTSTNLSKKKLPQPASPNDLISFYVTPARH